jgi:RNA polymerase sigma-70 factor (family 1)
LKPLTTYGSEHALLQRVAAGDQQAFRVLFDAWTSRLYHYTFQLTGSRELAEDIVQDSFLKIWLRRDQLPSIENFGAYLFRMAQNAVLNGLRRKATESMVLEKRMALPQPDAEPDTLLHIKLVKNVLEEAVKTLPEQQQKVWRLRREQGKHIKEIAGDLGLAEPTVKRHLSKAQATLRSILEKEFPMEGGILLTLLGLWS